MDWPQDAPYVWNIDESYGRRHDTQNMGRLREIPPGETIVLDSPKNSPSNSSSVNTIVLENQSNKSRLQIILTEFLPAQLPYLITFVGGFSLFYLQTNRIFQAIGIVMITSGFMATIGAANSSQPYTYYSGVLVSMPLVVLIYIWAKLKIKINLAKILYVHFLGLWR